MTYLLNRTKNKHQYRTVMMETIWERRKKKMKTKKMMRMTSRKKRKVCHTKELRIFFLYS